MTSLGPGATIAVTGATGFVGQALVEHLSEVGYRVVGISDARDPPARIRHLLLDFHSADLAVSWPATAGLDGVVHLAGLAAVGPSFDRPQEYIAVNSAIMTHFFEHALARNWGGRILVVSSGAVYGGRATERCFVETSPVIATSPYVLSKLLIEKQAEYYGLRGVDAVVVRPFNHIGPGQGRGFIVPDMVAKVSASQDGATVALGNLNSTRDYTDVRDIVRAYRLLLELAQPEFRLYNVCSGVARSGWNVLEAVCAALNRSVPEVTVDDTRAFDPSAVRGDAGRLARETSWLPKIGLANSVEDFVASQQVFLTAAPANRSPSHWS